jgi:ATP-dependent Clp protease ATP-binding subunit ClpC
MSREVTLRLEAFDRPAQRLIAAAQALADARKSAEVEPLHVLYRALEHSPLAQRAADAVLADGADLLVEAEALLRALPLRSGGAAFLSAATLALLQRAEALAPAPGLAGVAHVLAALADEPTSVRRALEACAIHPQAWRVAVQLAAQLSPPPEAFVPDARRRAAASAVPRFMRELSPPDHPIVGRDAELRRMLQVLARSATSHPLLVGEHGVGRRSLVHALAERLAAGLAPPLLTGKRVAELDLGQLSAGARLRGELEERAAQLVASLRGGDTILYVSDLEALLADRFEPVLDALTTALSRSALRLIAVAEPSALASPEAAGLLRHMVRVEVEPPSAEAAIAMLRASAQRLETAHQVTIDDTAIAAAAQLARRYVPSAQLPKSALDILDEAAAMQRIGPTGDPAAAAQAIAITEAHVAEAVASVTGIPVTRVQQTEADKLLALEVHLGARVIGQDAAVRALADAVRRGRVGLRDAKRPIGSFLFLGSSGVGKTELAKALADLLFDDEHALTRLDMSEFMEKHTVSRLLGSPPGYADSEQGGYLTEAVRRRPYSVVLFDEIEKAHPDVFNVLLQVLDDGRLTDSRGRVAHFADTVIILTSNIGSRRLIEHGEQQDSAAAHAAVMSELRAALRPELLNRIDEVVIFEALGKPELARILELQLASLGRLLAQRGVTLQLSDAAKRYIVEAGYDPAFGARPLRRVIQQKLQDPLAQMLLESGASTALSVEVDSTPDGDGLTLRKI